MEKQKLHAWIYAAGLLLFPLDAFFASIQVNWTDPHRESNLALLLEIIVMTLPYSAGFFAAVLQERWRDRLAAFAASWIIVPIVLSYFLVGGAFLRAGIIVGFIFLGLFAVLVCVHGAVAAFAFHSLRGLPGREWGLFLAVGYCVVPFLLHGQIPISRPGNPVPQVQPALEMLTLLDKCALEFAAKQTPKSYPDSLREFGSANLGCLPDAVANEGYSDEYHFSYGVTSRNDSGQATSYQALARWHSFWLNGVFELYTNQDTVFRWSEKGDAATKGHPPVRMAPQFDFSMCAFQRSSPYGQKQTPLTPELVMKNCFRYDDRYLKGQIFQYYHGRWQSEETGWLDKNTFDDGTSVWRVEMLEDASRDVSGFTLRVRPKDWGVTGFRSYLVQMDFWPPAKEGEIPPSIPKMTTHSTIEDRDATPDDPVVWSWGGEPPVQTAWMDNW